MIVNFKYCYLGSGYFFGCLWTLLVWFGVWFGVDDGRFFLLFVFIFFIFLILVVRLVCWFRKNWFLFFNSIRGLI